jgi:hypothetical protein
VSGRVVIAVALLLLCACATPTLRIEAEHVSHPLAGWPCEPQHLSEDDVTQANVLLHWQRRGWYADAGLGWNLQGNGGGGFYGPALTGTVRVGREFNPFNAVRR